MSFFSKFFTRSITYVNWIGRDEMYGNILHVFGAIRVMPEDGDSFDIYRHCIIDLDTYAVTNGIEQRGNDFSIKSAFAKRAVEAMSTQVNRKLKLKLAPAETEDEEGDDDEERVAEFNNLERDCEYPVVDADSGDSDTAEPKKFPKNVILYTKNKIGDRERFTVQLYKSGVGLAVHQMSGMHDYFRHVLYLKDSGRLLCTYRKENWMGSGGMAFFVLNANSGELLFNDMIK